MTKDLGNLERLVSITTESLFCVCVSEENSDNVKQVQRYKNNKVNENKSQRKKVGKVLRKVLSCFLIEDIWQYDSTFQIPEHGNILCLPRGEDKCF